MRRDKPLRRKLLLAEDNPDDVTLFTRAVAAGYTKLYELQVVTDGQQALDFLRKRGQWCNVWTPDLFVLNINMPKLLGWEVYRRMRDDPEIPVIPTIIWTIAEIEEYDARAYEWGLCGIFSKPIDTKDALRQVTTILDYFLEANPYPRDPDVRASDGKGI